MAAKAGPVLIRCGVDVAVPFVYSAQSVPGPIRKNITFVSASNPAVQWTVEVVGKVVANVWPQPDRVAIQYDRDEVAVGQVAVHRIPGVPEVSLVSSSQDVTLQLKGASPNARIFDVIINTPHSREGMADLSAVSADGSVLLTIPVEWHERPRALLSPNPLVLRKRALLKKPFAERSVIVFKGPKMRDVHSRINSRVPWIRVVETKENDGVAAVRLQIDAALMPNRFHGPVLDVVFATEPRSSVSLDAAVVSDDSLE